MRLDFNVLWVDDQPKRVEAQITKISNVMAQQGFQFNPKLCTTVEEVRAATTADVFTDEIDMMLVDWDLGEGVHGQDAIAVIREHVRFKDVVFYSGLTEPDDLRKAAFDAGLEGVYCATREDLIDEVTGVFESLVKKVLDLDHVRGIVMGASCDIDNIVNECLLAMHGQLDDTGKRKMIEESMTRTTKHMEDFGEKVAKLQGASSMEEFFAEHQLFTSIDRLRLLGATLKAGPFKVHATARKSVGSYMNKVVPQRNVLGHQVLVPEGKPQQFATDKGKTISAEEVRELRCAILDLRSDFRNLLSALRKG